MIYLAKITLRNGTEVELQAGGASFLPSKPEISTLLPTTIKVDEKKGKSWLANQRISKLDEDEENKDKILFPGLDATISFDQIPQLKQGDNILLNGKVVSTNASYEFVSIAIRLENRADPKWALDQLVTDKRSDLYEELKKRTDYSNDDSSRWFFNDDRATVSVTILKQQHLYLKGKNIELRTMSMMQAVTRLANILVRPQWDQISKEQAVLTKTDHFLSGLIFPI